MLYPKNKNKSLPLELFKKPTSEYRGTPFWSWNCRVTKEQINEQIDNLKEMGMGGFHIHCRSGMDVEYLSDEFMKLVKESNEKAKDNNMLCWLYDEDRWPSGFAGGLVTKDIKYRSRFLVFSPYKYEKDSKYTQEYDSSARAQRSNNRKLLGKYEVILKDGFLHDYRRLNENEGKNSNTWWAYLEISGDNPWYNNQAYVNTLDKEAINEFVRVTHERYYEVLGDEFGKSVPSIFTDEPQFTHKEILGYANEKKELTVPFTDDFEETFIKTYGESFLEKLPEIFWELPDGQISLTRYHYHDHVSERFAEAFADTIGGWCEEHGIMLTGHMMEEPTLMSQTAALGEAMRSYRSFQLPGIDMLCDRREYSTAKQAQSASHQYGCPGVLSELYGVTNWDFDFRGHKLQGDWQAALGVTTRVHHLTWMSMNGEAKRDYPASIGYQSPWYREYSLIEDYFSRLNTTLTRGKPSVKVGVIHPIESYWLHFGPKEHTDDIRNEMENNFNNIINWLLFGLIDFDFICESLLPYQSEIRESSKFQVGKMEYDVIIVPGCETLRSTTIDRLETFQNGDGKIVFLGEIPTLENAVKSNRVIKLSDNGIKLPFTKTKLLRYLEKYRDIDVRKEDGSPSDNLFYQIRDDNDNKWLFLSHVNKMENKDVPIKEKIEIRIKGLWKPTIYDCITGETYPCSFNIRNSNIIINHEFFQHDSLLFLLEPLREEKCVQVSSENKKKLEIESKGLGRPMSIQLSEHNVLLLDMAQYSLNNEPWSDREEVLRIDNILRKRLNYPLKMSALAQPWTMSNEEKKGNRVKLKYTIKTEVDVEEVYLALEDVEETEIIVNGNVIDNTIVGWYVDKCIKKVKLPTINRGINELILNVPFEPKSNMEWCYLLGDFGVRVEGNTATIIEPARNILFGDWTTQGLPFYAGNVTYLCEIESKGEEIEIEIPQFRNPLLSIAVDNDEKGKIAFSPYKLNLGYLDEGKHTIKITAYGNRVNSFGTVHNCNATTEWYGPDAWRTTGASWSYEYQIKPTGVLVSPVLKCSRED